MERNDKMNGKRKEEEEEDGKENKLAGFSLCLSHILIFSLLSFSPDALLISLRKSMGQRVVDVPVFFVRACVCLGRAVVVVERARLRRRPFQSPLVAIPSWGRLAYFQRDRSLPIHVPRVSAALCIELPLRWS
jgi:hypothetical protein